MSGHLIITILICATTCQPMEAQVWDGDTFRIRGGSGFEKIRVSNIDTPEVDGRCASETKLAVRAKERLAGLLASGSIKIDRQGLDRYKRRLATVRSDAGDVGDILINEGLARPWTGRRQPWCGI